MKQLKQEAKKIVNKYPMPEKGVCLKDVLSMCQPVMKELCGRAGEPEDWLKYLYDYLATTYYPENFQTDFMSERKPAVDFYFQVLKKLFLREKKETPFDRCRDFQLLTDIEREQCEIKEEYDRFLDCFYDYDIYEFLRISRECTPFDTLGHIAGVHHVSMYIGRQLKEAGIQIDLGLMSAAAIIHDIGKFGCKGKEVKRIPYLHYYYTDQFAKKFHFHSIGHIAANHSTWDLELENLSVENLLLIYADFRVKSIRDADGVEQVCFWSLDESYDIILSKLDNVDNQKKNRYRKVFMKLKDFESYIVSLGCSTDLISPFTPPAKRTDPALMSMEEMIQSLKYQAVNSNIMVMHNINLETRFINLLEEIKSEKDWRNIRSYLNIIEEYSTYMKRNQKDIIIQFLYEMLLHRDGDIRRQAAAILSHLIAQYEKKYQKEIPDGATIPDTGKTAEEIWSSLLRMMLIPDHKITEQHKRWIGYAMKTVFQSLLNEIAPEKRNDILQTLVAYYKKTDWEDLVLFLLMDCAADIPYRECKGEAQSIMTSFAMKLLAKDDIEIQVAALRFIKLWLQQGWKPDETVLEQLQDILKRWNKQPACALYLIDKIRHRLGWIAKHEIKIFEASSLFLENQRVDTPWIFKLVNLEILKDQCRESESHYAFQLAAHLANMLQTSDRIVIRHQAGNDLTEMMYQLSYAERYEIAMELSKGLEMGEYSVSKYIPEYLGQIFFYLSKEEQNEFLVHFRTMIDSSNYKVAIVTLDTIGVIMQQLPFYLAKYPSYGSGYQRTEDIVEGLLFRGMAHYADEVAQETFYIIGHNIFDSKQLSMKQKEHYFQIMCRKILTLMNQEKKELYLYNNAAALNHIYRFLSDYLFMHESFPALPKKRIAFFPGTFDPFSLGHKKIVDEIRRQGFLVYLALDEFSWSKKTQPYKVRRKILTMSTADLKDVYLFPADIPVNIANPKDLKRLSDAFGGQDIYFVMGSDVVENASAYRIPPEEYSIHRFSHIIFNRNITGNQSKNKNPADLIRGKIHYLSLPTHYENISSTKIRDNIDLNRDISNLIDDNVQNYIYDMGLYSMEPLYKKMVKTKAINSMITDKANDNLLAELKLGLLKDYSDQQLAREQAVIIRDEKDYNRITGIVLFHPVPLSELYEECKNADLADRLRKHISGKVAVISAIFGTSSQTGDNRQTALTEMLAYCLRQEYTYVLYLHGKDHEELLLRQGFLPIDTAPDCYVVNLGSPIVLFFDTYSSIKEPLGSNPVIREKIWQCHLKYQEAMTLLYPGNLVLSLESDILNHRLIQLITAENQVPSTPLPVRKLGEKMCVPFGNILKGILVPNCVTKSLDTEKLYAPDMEHFQIKEFANYAPLRTQIRAIKSFGRPVILVDDIYHKGYRIQELDPLLKEEKVEISKIIVGVLSGKGSDLAKLRDKKVDSAYFIPNMRAWFIESDFYPFIGGDSIKVTDRKQIKTAALPSINPILPYYMPHFLKNISQKAFYKLSEICLDNAEDILRSLEKEYQKLSGRKLTMERIGEIMAEPRYPDIGSAASYSPHEAPSAYIEYEKQRLVRLKSLIGLRKD